MTINLTNNCIAQYKMNDNADNSTVINEYGINGTYIGENPSGEDTSLNSVPGVINNALTFNGVSSYVDTNQTFISTFQSEFTISLWVNITETIPAGDHKCFIGVESVSGSQVDITQSNAGILTISYLVQGNGGGVSTGIPAFSTTGPHHVVCSVSQASVSPTQDIRYQIYIDGVLRKDTIYEDLGILMSNYDNSTVNLSIGRYAYNLSGFYYFDSFIDNVLIFDKLLDSNEIAFLYNEGFGTESLSLTAPSINAPTITYPNGGETFTEGDINIQWKESEGLLSTDLTWYEIFITDSYDSRKKEELIQIATVPAGNTSYSYTIEKNLRGNKSRIGIRSVNHKGERSRISLSADDFIIINEFLPSPALIEPIKGNTYFSYVPFIFDHDGVKGRCSQRSFYQVYYKSDNQDIDWTLLKSNIMVGADPIDVDISSFRTDSDYVFKIELVDGDNISAPVFIDDINLNNINFFLIDTTPPRGTIKIVNNEEYTNNKSLILKLSASDETSAVKDVQIQQTNTITGEGNNLEVSPFIPFTSLLTWDIKPEGNSTEVVDGVKLIRARFRDYGQNSLIIDDKKYFRTYKNLENREVTAFLYDTTNEYLYSVFGEDMEGSSAELYRDLTFISTLDGDATALEMYYDILYIGIKDDKNKGVLQRLTNSTVSTVADNEDQYLDVAGMVVNSLYATDSVINVMEVFDNTLFLGLDNGEILSFKGSVVSLENDTYSNIRSVRNIRTDGILLYIFFQNTTEIMIMNKDSSGSYVFSTVSTES